MDNPMEFDKEDLEKLHEDIESLEGGDLPEHEDAFTCAGCMFYRGLECCYYPPELLTSMSKKQDYIQVRPTMEPDEFCSKWEPKLDETVQ